VLPFAEALPRVSGVAMWDALRLTLVPLGFGGAATLAAHLCISRGVLFVPTKLKPDIANISPLKTVKNLVSLRNFLEFIKSLVKIVFLGALCFNLIANNLGDLFWSAGYGIGALLTAAWILMSRMLLISAAVFLVIGLFDKWLQGVIFRRSQRMSKDEIKRENKQTEGDPMFKSHRKREHERLAKGDVKAGVLKSHALVVNPTHVAVALRYVPSENALPVVTARGAGSAARFMRALARLHHIPMVQDIELARGLWRDCDVDDPIPMAWAESVAQVFVAIEDVIDATSTSSAP
jgi:type III secretion protein U